MAILLLLLLLLLLSLSSPAFSFTAFSPPDNHLISCGGGAASSLADGRIFSPDSPSHLSSSSSSSSVAIPHLYRSARIFTSTGSYSFAVSRPGVHIVRLHFLPFSPHLFSAAFHVAAAGFTLLKLSNFTSPAPFIKEYFISVHSDTLEIHFIPADESSFAFVNAIEVFSAPDDLIADVATLILPDRIETHRGLLNNAMETLYRVNVGGPLVTPYNDTLWRTWHPDTPFFVKESHSREVSFYGRIMYREFGASREVAPDSVYRTGRALHSNNTLSSNTRMSWVFNLGSSYKEYKYLIRMHFCDIASMALHELYFNVYVNGILAYENFDISDASGNFLASPYYMDLVVGNYDGSGVLRVAVGPSNYSSPFKVAALLNGLEIMRINSSSGSLSDDGEVLSTVGMGPHQKGASSFAPLSWLLCVVFVSLLPVVLFLFLRVLITEIRKEAGWSLLPTNISQCNLGKENLEPPVVIQYV